MTNRLHTAAEEAISSLDSISRCFVVSLADDTKRRNHMLTLMSGHGLEFEFWTGIHGALLDPVDIESNGWLAEIFCRGRDPRWLRLNQLGCALSHYLLAKHILSSELAVTKPVLILEDDVSLEPGFSSRIDDLVKSCPPTIDVLYLGYHEPRFQPLQPMFAKGLRNAFAPRGTYGYVLWNSGAEKVVSGLFPIDLPIDEILARWVKSKKLAALVADPVVVHHPYEFSSTIHTRRHARWLKPSITRSVAVTRIHQN